MSRERLPGAVYTREPPPELAHGCLPAFGRAAPALSRQSTVAPGSRRWCCNKKLPLASPSAVEHRPPD
eukprot:14500458-Alexandrium_andersonii.AAC.1